MYTATVENRTFLQDAIEAPRGECAQATYNLHVLTQLGWPGKAGCAVQPASPITSLSLDVAASSSTLVTCRGLNDIALDVSIIRPDPAALAADRLLEIEADPLPIQFTGMTGSALPRNSTPVGMAAVGGAFGGDWNADGGIPPEGAHWAPRTPTWLRLKAAAPLAAAGAEAAGGTAGSAAGEAGCRGFLTLLQPRNATAAAVKVESVEELSGGAVTVTTATTAAAAVAASAGRTVYVLGARRESGSTLNGLAAVVSWAPPTPSPQTEAQQAQTERLRHAMLIRGSELVLGPLKLAASRNVTIRVEAIATDQ